MDLDEQIRLVKNMDEKDLVATLGTSKNEQLNVAILREIADENILRQYARSGAKSERLVAIEKLENSSRENKQMFLSAMTSEVDKDVMNAVAKKLDQQDLRDLFKNNRDNLYKYDFFYAILNALDKEQLQNQPIFEFAALNIDSHNCCNIAISKMDKKENVRQIAMGLSKGKNNSFVRRIAALQVLNEDNAQNQKVFEKAVMEIEANYSDGLHYEVFSTALMKYQDKEKLYDFIRNGNKAADQLRQMIYRVKELGYKGTDIFVDLAINFDKSYHGTLPEETIINIEEPSSLRKIAENAKNQCFVKVAIDKLDKNLLENQKAFGNVVIRYSNDENKHYLLEHTIVGKVIDKITLPEVWRNIARLAKHPRVIQRAIEKLEINVPENQEIFAFIALNSKDHNCKLFATRKCTNPEVLAALCLGNNIFAEEALEKLLLQENVDAKLLEKIGQDSLHPFVKQKVKASISLKAKLDSLQNNTLKTPQTATQSPKNRLRKLFSFEARTQ